MANSWFEIRLEQSRNGCILKFLGKWVIKNFGRMNGDLREFIVWKYFYLVVQN